MAFYKKINFTSDTDIYIWKITETLENLKQQVVLNERSKARLENMKSESHQKGFLAVRMLLQLCGYTDHDLLYDQTGKPSLIDGKKISITHSFDFSVIAISDEEVGIDIELRREKVLRIANKFSKEEFVQPFDEATKTRLYTTIWGAKEAIFKIMNEPGISFLDHIMVSSFELIEQKTEATLFWKQDETKFNIDFKEIENYTLVHASKK